MAVPPASKPRRRKLKPPMAAIGWREWVSIPQLGIDSIKAKVDTGARTSSLHAFKIKTFEQEGVEYVRFLVHPVQRKSQPTIECVCPIYEYRKVRSSSGHVTRRPVIVVEIEAVGTRLAVELTLANRDQMGFRMLLGREALRGRFLVDSGKSYLGGRPGRPITSKTDSPIESPPQKTSRKKKSS